MKRADFDLTHTREYICKSQALNVLRYGDKWVQFTVIGDDLFFRDWHVIEALGAPSAAYANHLLQLLPSQEVAVVLVDRGPHREPREVGGFTTLAGARRMAEAVRSRPRRKRFIAWLDAQLPQQIQEDQDGRAGAQEPGPAAAARRHAVMPLSGRVGDRAPHPRT